MWETWVQSLGWEDTLEKAMTIHFSILAWRISWIFPYGRKRRTKESLNEKESEKVGVKLNIQKTKIVASGPITSWQLMGKQWKQ